MDIRQLRHPVAIAAHGSFSRAARTLSVVRPALSRRIRLVEEGLVTPLSHRNGQRVAITTAGAILLTLVATPIVAPSLTRVMVLATAGRALDASREVIEVVRDAAADRGAAHPPGPVAGRLG